MKKRRDRGHSGQKGRDRGTQQDEKAEGQRTQWAEGEGQGDTAG